MMDDISGAGVWERSSGCLAAAAVMWKKVGTNSV